MILFVLQILAGIWVTNNVGGWMEDLRPLLQASVERTNL
jgi:hypothetical protein